MFIDIDLSNPKPTYLQIVDAVRRAIATGALEPGDKLPTIREVAVQARVNRNTVSRSYLELEHQGLVYNRQGSGCFVSDEGPQRERENRDSRIQELADELTLEAHLAGQPVEETITIIQQSAERLHNESGNRTKGHTNE